MKDLFRVPLVALAAAVAIMPAVGPQAHAELVDGVRAVVHDSIITYYQVYSVTEPLVNRLRSEYAGKPELLRERMGEARDQALNRMVENQLVLHEYTTGEYNHAHMENIIEEQFQASLRAEYGKDRVSLIKTLQQEGKSYEQIRREFRDRFIVQQMRYFKTASEVMVSPHKIEVFYVEHQDEFKVPSQVKLRMIVLARSAENPDQAKNLAQEILAKLKDGASFAEMASVYSVDARRNPGGDWGWWEAAKLRSELAAAAPTLKPGEHSGIIETPEACYIMLVEDRRPEHVRPLNEVRDAIESELLDQEHNRLQAQWIERLKNKTFVRYFQ